MSTRTRLIEQKVIEIREQLGLAQGTGEQLDLRYDGPIAKAFLLKGSWFFNGRLLEPVTKPLGLGVYLLTSKEK